MTRFSTAAAKILALVVALDLASFRLRLDSLLSVVWGAGAVLAVVITRREWRAPTGSLVRVTAVIAAYAGTAYLIWRSVINITAILPWLLAFAWIVLWACRLQGWWATWLETHGYWYPTFYNPETRSGGTDPPFNESFAVGGSILILLVSGMLLLVGGFAERLGVVK